jgi:hypothetical protein
MAKPLLLFYFFCFISISLIAQMNTYRNTYWDTYHASLGVQGILTTSDHVPFWMRANQFGSVPLPGASGSFIGAVRKDYDSSADHLVDWGASVEARGDAGSSSRATLIEGYVKLRVSIFELKGGRVKDFTGLVDSTLSTGSFAVSGNALGIPKLQLSIPNYWSLPFFGRLFAVQGTFAVGWVGKAPITVKAIPDSIQLKTYFHQLSFYGRLGRPDWPLKLYGGFNHEVFWGGEREFTGPRYKLSGFKTFEYAVIGKTYLGSKIGNHLGSIDLGIEYSLGNMRLFLYRQNFYDEGALAKLANLADGLNGISITNTTDMDDEDDDGFHSHRGLQWRKVVLEFFCSKNQAGYPSSKRTNSGDENYYNNYQYSEGWSYKGMGLGNPFISPYTTTRKGQAHDPVDYFINNRVVAFHAGFEGSVNSLWFSAKASYSFNYGNFGTSIWGYSTGGSFHPPSHGIFKEVRQFSSFLEVAQPLDNGYQIGVAGAWDSGHLLYNSAGLIVKLTKTF